MSRRGGGHGGAWKVAYADFVTAMMALFLVLWIVAVSQEMKESIAGYFRSTAIFRTEKKAVGSLSPITKMARIPPRVTPPTPSNSADQGGESWAHRTLPIHSTLSEIQAVLQKVLRRNNDELSDKDAFRFEFTNDGLRIEVIDRAVLPLFREGTAELTDHGMWVLTDLAWEIERYNVRIEVEGHVQSAQGSLSEGIGAWDLSARRALAAQQYLEKKGIRPDKFWRVAGYADRQPLDRAHPDLEANRRIAILLRLDPTSDYETIRRSFLKP